MEYACSKSFEGSSEAAMDAARTQLMAVGFRLDQRSDRELVATGPGMRSSRQPAVYGATRIVLNVLEHQIDLEAELGGVRFMRRFLWIFPFALAGGLTLFFGVLRNFTAGVALVPFLAVSPWIVLAPVLSRAIRNRTNRALDTLVENMIDAARRG